MTFAECVLHCARNKELVAQFDRLWGANLSLKGSPIVRMIDEATGKQKADIEAWFAFVWDCVWSRLPDEAFTDSTRTDIKERSQS